MARRQNRVHTTVSLLASLLWAGGVIAAESARAGDPQTPRFVDVAAAAGVEHAYTGDWTHYVGGGVAAFASLEALPEDTRLRAGAFVEVLLEGPELQRAVRLPPAAVFDGGTVYRIGADDRLEAVEVAVRAREGASLLVQGPLEDGQRVVLTRFPEIAPGVRVQVP